MDHHTGEPKGFAFVDFASAGAAARFVEGDGRSRIIVSGQAVIAEYR